MYYSCNVLIGLENSLDESVEGHVERYKTVSMSAVG